MLLPVEVDVQLQRVPKDATSTGKPGKVHLVVQGYTLHDLAQKTVDAGRWPWKHATERVGAAEFAEAPCLICKAALDGKALPGRV